MTALAGAIRTSGALASISFINLDYNHWSMTHNNANEAGKKQMRDVAEARGFQVELA